MREKPAGEKPKRPRAAEKKIRPKTPPPRAAKSSAPAEPVREMTSFYPAGGEAVALPPARPSPKRKTAAEALPQKIGKRRTGKIRKASAPPARISTARLPSVQSAPPAGTPGPEDTRRILLQIVNRIRRARRYPAAARRMGIEGTAVVSFHIRPEGGVQNVKIRKSSGHPLLDSASIDAVRRAAPLPYLRQALVLPIRYTLREASD